MLIYQVDARILVGEASRLERRPVTLDSVPAEWIETLAGRGFDWLWLCGTWEPDAESREALRRDASAIEACRDVLPDLELADLDGWETVGRHTVRHDLGGIAGLEAFRDDLAAKSIRLVLDFFPSTTKPAPRASLDELERLAGWADAAAVASGDAAEEDWSSALARARTIHPHFLLLEASGRGSLGAFAAAMDAELPRLLRDGDPEAIRAGLAATGAGGASRVRHLERHGGERAARAFEGARGAGAALVTYLAPGHRLFHDGQIEGRRIAQDFRLSRRALEEPDDDVLAFHERLFELVARPEVASGRFSLREVRPAWEDNVTWRQLVVYLWEGNGPGGLVVAVNLGGAAAQCYANISALEPAGREWMLQDLTSLNVYERDGNDLAARGLYLDLPPWDYNVFEVRPGRPL
jgi:hypothetical protein